MKRLGYFLLVIIAVAAGFWGYQQFFTDSGEPAADGKQIEIPSAGDGIAGPEAADSPEGEPGSGDAGQPSRDPIGEDAAARGQLRPGQATSPRPARESAAPPPSKTQSAPPGPAAVPVLGGTLEPAAGKEPTAEERKEAANPFAGAPIERLQEAVELARSAFDRGETGQGIEIYRQVFLAARDRADVSVVPVARKLVELTRPEEEKVDYHRYLAARDSDPQWVHQSSLAAGAALASRRDAEAVRSAWDLLTRAYLAAASDADRKRVLAVLNPFLEKYLFSKRFSPLVVGHTVKEGDSLDRIARRAGTTIDAIKRLNRLERIIIQPGQRLIVLPGTVRIFIKKRDFRLWVLVDGKLLMERPIGLGRDNSTPEGTFVIQNCQRDPIWYRPGEAPIQPGDRRNILGTRWLGFKDTDDYVGFGIHGTREADSIGKESSSGCIRLLNEDIELLYDFVPPRTEVVVED